MIHIQKLAQAFGEDVNLKLSTDASAARGALMRCGAGELKHLSAKHLWMQEYISEGALELVKVDRAANGADALTHAWTKKERVHFLHAGFAFYPAEARCYELRLRGGCEDIHA